MAKQKAKKQKTFAVIGVGRFGSVLARELHESGAEVLAVDSDPERVNEIEPFCTQAVCADAANERVLDKLGIHNFDVVIVCIGEIEASVFVTLTCKQAGVPKLIAKAQNRRHREILEKIGADRVVIPEEEMGEKVAAALLTPNVIEIMSFSEKFRMVEVITPEIWQNRALKELNLRNTAGVAIILIKRGTEIIATPSGDCILLPDDILVVAGSNADIGKLSAQATKEVPVDNE
jgi:trk system potassium uptake protein TrkA